MDGQPPVFVGGLVMPRARTLYDTQAWRSVRLTVLARDGKTCQLRCTRKCRGVANSVDHIIRPEDGGALYDPTNLQAACMPCNAAKAKILEARRARRWDERGGRRDW